MIEDPTQDRPPPPAPASPPAPAPTPASTEPIARAETAAPSAGRRVLAIDAYRGLVMLMMASAGLGIGRIASDGFPESDVWRFLAYEVSHVEWAGCSLWDLIQPSFMFLVGVALPFSYAARRARGQPYASALGHAIYRALVLVLLGIFLMSNWSAETDFTFVNVLTQIGLGYIVVFLLAGKGRVVQIGAAVAILAGIWYLFYQHPVPGADLDRASVGVGPEFPWYEGLFAHWNKNVNYASDWDVWFLNLFPRSEPFRFNEGGYQTLNFVPSISTMLLGLASGEVLRGVRPPEEKARRLLVGGLVCILMGLLAGITLCPIVKRIWSPSWTLFAGGITIWVLTAFYWVTEVRGLRLWAFPLVVVGTNSIVMYCMAHLIRPWVANSLRIHLGQGVFERFGAYAPMAQEAGILLVLWLICLWLYRKRIFIRI